MQYGRIISITGMGGLYELVGSKADGAIVRSLEDGVTKFVSSRIHSFSHLESIEVYTERENVNLVEIFVAMNASTEPLPAEKDAAAVKAYFGKVFAAMDFERVYASDMKKMVRWFGILKKIGVEFTLEAPADEAATADAVVEAPAAEVVEEAPKKKATRKKKESAD
jgi:hypothetical protein